MSRRVDVSPLARVCRHGEVVLRGASCSSLPGREDRARPPPWNHEGTRLRWRAPGAAEAARSSRRQRADAVRPLRRDHPSRHAVRPRPRRRRPDALPRSRACGLQPRRSERPESDEVGMTPMPTPTLRPRYPVSSSSDCATIGGMTYALRRVRARRLQSRREAMTEEGGRRLAGWATACGSCRPTVLSAPLSSLLLLGLHGNGESTDRRSVERSTYPGTYGLERGETASVTPRSQRPSPPQPPLLSTRRCRNAHLLTLGRNFQTAGAVRAPFGAIGLSRGGGRPTDRSRESSARPTRSPARVMTWAYRYRRGPTPPPVACGRTERAGRPR